MIKREREYANRLFQGLFRNSKNFKELYEDISNKTLDEEIKPYNLRNEIMNNMLYRNELENDVAFITESGKLLVLVEHQSSKNDNMALRCGLYYFNILQEYIKENGLNIHRPSSISIPIPEFYVVYNGLTELKECEYTLNNNFFESSEFISLRVPIIDVNYNKIPTKAIDNNDMLCGYSFCISKLREYQKAKMKYKEAINKLREELKQKNLLLDYLDGKEFEDMVLGTWTYEDEMNAFKEQGIEQGIEQAIVKLFKNGMTAVVIAENLDLELSSVEEILEKNK